MLLDRIASVSFLEKTNGASEQVEDFTEPQKEPVFHGEASGFLRKQVEVRVQCLWRALNTEVRITHFPQ